MLTVKTFGIWERDDPFFGGGSRASEVVAKMEKVTKTRPDKSCRILRLLHL